MVHSTLGKGLCVPVVYAKATRDTSRVSASDDLGIRLGKASLASSTVIWSLRHWVCCTAVAVMASSSPRHELAFLHHVQLAVGGEGLADVLRRGLGGAPGGVYSVDLPCAALGAGRILEDAEMRS